MKKGFTLVELLAVIVILSVILVMAVPNILNIIEKSRIDAHIKNEEMMINAAKKYLVSNASIAPTNIGDTIEIKLSDLNTSKLIDTIKNPRDSNNCGGYVLVTKIGDNSYDYSPHLSCVDFDIVNTEVDGLIGHWKLDNGQAIDYSKNNNNGVVNGATATADRFVIQGKALSFNGIDNFIEIPDAVGNQLHGDEEASVSLWLNLNSGNPSVERSGIIQLSGYENTNGCLYPYQGDKIYVDTFRTNRVGGIYFPGVVLNEWHNLIITTKPGENGWRLYLNGNLIYSTSGQYTVATNYLSFRIGNNSYSRWLDGKIDDVRIYNRALTANEIKQLYNMESARSAQ